MKYPFYYMTDEMIERLKQLGAKSYTVSKNYGSPHQHLISSIHFYKDEKPEADGHANEVAYFLPELHSHEFGRMSGFNEINRRNAIDVRMFGMNKIEWGEM